MKDDKFLTDLREPPRREFAQELYERINKPMYEKTTFNIFNRRLTLAFGVVLFLLMATLILSPQARAYAGQQLRQIGAFIFTDGSRPENQLAATAQPTIAPPAAQMAQFAGTQAAASDLAGFGVLSPAYLPSGYSFTGRWSVASRDSSVYVVSTYEGESAADFLILNQTRFASGATFEQRYGQNETLEEITVAGQPAAWISGRLMANPGSPPPADGGQPALVATNWLIWEENGLTYSLFGTSLEQEEMVKIAESLQ